MISLKVENDFLLENFTHLRFELLEFLRQRLDNRYIEASATVSELSEIKPLMYSPQEKYKFLAEKYPLVNDLVRKLGLDFEY